MFLRDLDPGNVFFLTFKDEESDPEKPVDPTEDD